MVRRIVTFHQPYSDKLFQGVDFSTPCKHDGFCDRKKCRFPHFKKNPRDKILARIAKDKEQKQKKKKQKKKKTE